MNGSGFVDRHEAGRQLADVLVDRGLVDPTGWHRVFDQTTDDEVVRLLAASAGAGR